MHKIIRSVFIVLLISSLALAAAKAPNAETVLSEAKAKAAAQHKSIFLIFGATWCPDCHTVDHFLSLPEVHAIFDKYFVVTQLSVAEQYGNHPELENPGAIELLGKLGGILPSGDVSVPFFVVLDQNGSPLINSNRPVKDKPEGDSIGFPTRQEQIAWMMTMIKKGAPTLTEDEARVLESKIRGAGEP